MSQQARMKMSSTDIQEAQSCICPECGDVLVLIPNTSRGRCMNYAIGTCTFSSYKNISTKHLKKLEKYRQKLAADH